MLSNLAAVLPPSGPASAGGVTLEAVAVYGLVALVIGLIVWSKYNEPPLSDPYAKKPAGGALPNPATPTDLGPAVPVRVVEPPATERGAPS